MPGSGRRVMLCLRFERLCTGECEWGAQRKAPDSFCPFWTSVHDSPPGAPEEDLGVTAGENCRTWLSHGLLGQGTHLSCPHHPSPVPTGAPLPATASRVLTAMARPCSQQPRAGGTCVAIAQLGPFPEQQAGLETSFPAADPPTCSLHP